ncbi:MAG: hypothetical protein K2O94_03970, partial [Clostridiales bacterium]|nr:hypothetical protein [Clostridiales bacterium]
LRLCGRGSTWRAAGGLCRCAAIWAYFSMSGGGRDVLITALAACMLLLALYSLFLCCLGIYRRRAIHAPVPRLWAYFSMSGGGRDVLITVLAAYMLLLTLYSLFLCCSVLYTAAGGLCHCAAIMGVF